MSGQSTLPVISHAGVVLGTTVAVPGVLAVTGMRKIGNVTEARYGQIVAEARRLVDQQTRTQFAIGDLALEIEPMRPHGGMVAERGVVQRRGVPRAVR